MNDINYAARLVWSGAAQGPTRTVESYSREFRVEIEGKPSLAGSADPSFQGDPGLHNPEELLLSALSACHMLSYLAVCAHSGIAVRSYEDEAAGTVTRKDRHMQFADVVLRPRVVLEPGSDLDKATRLHEKAHDICIIANSVSFPVRHEPEVTLAESAAAE